MALLFYTGDITGDLQDTINAGVNGLFVTDLTNITLDIDEFANNGSEMAVLIGVDGQNTGDNPFVQMFSGSDHLAVVQNANAFLSDNALDSTNSFVTFAAMDSNSTPQIVVIILYLVTPGG